MAFQEMNVFWDKQPSVFFDDITRTAKSAIVWDDFTYVKMFGPSSRERFSPNRIEKFVDTLPYNRTLFVLVIYEVQYDRRQTSSK
jgi:hypothetical protein